MPQGAMWPVEFAITPAGAFLKTISFVPDQPTRILRFSIVDTEPAEIVAELVEGREDAGSCSFCATVIDDRGRILSAAGDTVYRIHSLDRDGRPTRTWERTTLPAVARTQEELTSLTRAARGRAGVEGGGTGAAFSPFRPRFSPGALAVDSRDRLWALASQPDVPGTNLDVFEPSGRYLGTRAVSEELTSIRIRNGFLLGIGETEIGEPAVFRYRIQD